MKTLCLFNPRAGRCDEKALNRAFRGRDRGRDYWGQVDFHRLAPSRGDWAEAMHAGDKVMVLGGDGTIHHVIQHLAHKPVELHVIPAGTANDLGYCLGLEGGLAQCMALLEKGRTVAYDTIAVNGRHVITGGGFGLGYLAAHRANRLRNGKAAFFFRHGLGAKIYLLTLGWHGLIAPPQKRAYTLEAKGCGEARSGITQSILFCNQALMGKRVLIAPGTSGMDGRFHLVEFLHSDTHGILRSLAGLKAGARFSDPCLRRAELQSATLEFDEAIPAYGDGEEFPAQKRWDMVCQPGAIRLRVPAAFVASHD